MSDPVPGEGYRPVLARLALLLGKVRALLVDVEVDAEEAST